RQGVGASSPVYGSRGTSRHEGTGRSRSRRDGSELHGACAGRATIRCWADLRRRLPTVILPKRRDPRLVTIRRVGTLTDADHQLLALWAASCAEHVLHLFESAHPEDARPRQAIEQARAWVCGEVTMLESPAAGG